VVGSTPILKGTGSNKAKATPRLVCFRGLIQISDNHPCPFHMGVPLPPGCYASISFPLGATLGDLFKWPFKHEITLGMGQSQIQTILWPKKKHLLRRLHPMGRPDITNPLGITGLQVQHCCEQVLFPPPHPHRQESSDKC